MDDANDRWGADQTIFEHGPSTVGIVDSPDKAREKGDELLGVSHGMTLPDEEDVAPGAPGCQRCEVVPTPIRGPGTLHLRLPHTYTLGKVLAYLAESPWPHREQDGTVSITAPAGSLAPVLSPIVDQLTSVEARDSRAVFQPAGQPMLVADFFEIEALPAFVNRVRSTWLLEILRGRRIRSVFHPILCTPRPEDGGAAYEVHGYECLMRAEGEDGPVMPGPMIEMARRADLVFQLDLAARRSALTGAAEHRIGGRHKLFVNFTPNAIYNPESCLASTVRMVDEVGLRRDQVVFEVVESERLPEGRLLERIVAFYREQGFGVALDDLGAGFASLSVLLAVRPDYVKLDMNLVRGVHLDAAKALVARKLVETAHELGMRTIAEGVEQPEELAWCAEQSVEFVQGFLFARPAAPPPL